MERGGLTPLFYGQPRLPYSREPRLAGESGSEAPRSKNPRGKSFASSRDNPHGSKSFASSRDNPHGSKSFAAFAYFAV